jgi:hypothetical protein
LHEIGYGAQACAEYEAIIERAFYAPFFKGCEG